MDTVEIRLPAYWAPCIINGDDSGMEESEVDAIDHTLAQLNLWAVDCIDCHDEAEFELRPAWAPWLQSGAYATYVFVQRVEPMLECK